MRIVSEQQLISKRIVSAVLSLLLIIRAVAVSADMQDTVDANSRVTADFNANSINGIDPTIDAVATKLPRIVSINLCADQLLLTFADSAQIVSLSNLSHDPAGSFNYLQARAFPTNTGRVEEVLPMQPDLVIAGQYTSRYTLRLLESVGLEVKLLPIANSIDVLFENLHTVATWTGHQQQGVELVESLRARLASITMPAEAKPRIAVYDPNGYTVGANSLRGQALELAGWHNVASDIGIANYGSLPLETLIRMNPDALLESPYSPGTWSRAQALSHHPALEKRGLAATVVTVPSSQTICGGPWTVDLIEFLQQQRHAIQQ